MLNKRVAELIAAGEVVERPSSVVKEIVENSIDANAKKIIVEIKNGGIKRIKISDDGTGIFKDDIKKAFLRHATSKVFTEDDLNSIGTLGFRGEALASISAVSRIELITKTAEEKVGTRYLINHENNILEDFGHPKGTTIIVKDLFFNTPARMKFLKKDVAEGNLIAGLIDKLALSHPEISFKFTRENNTALLTPGDSKVSSCIYAIYGKELFENIIPLNYELRGIKVTGYISKPGYSKASRNIQHFFVNGRIVKTKSMSSALEEAFKGTLMVGKHPCAVVYINLLHEATDVNVHPAKIEVKFINEQLIFSAIYYAVKSALCKHDDKKLFSFDISKRIKEISYNNFENTKKETEKEPENIEETIEYNDYSVKIIETKTPVQNFNSAQDFQETYINKLTANDSGAYQTDFNTKKEDDVKITPKTKIEAEQQTTTQTIEQLQTKIQHENEENYRIIGEIFSSYIIVEVNCSELIFVDKHAAHERIIYEKISKIDKIEVQVLLSPVVVSLEKNEYYAVIENLKLLKNLGFDVKNFGINMVVVSGIPSVIGIDETGDSIVQISNDILKHKKNTNTEHYDSLCHSIACRAAIKCGKNSSNTEILDLIKKLKDNPKLLYCPHGRPIYLKFDKNFIKKQFGRT